MKVITFSRQFPKGHIRAGEPAYFVEKIWKCLYEINKLSGVNERDYQNAFPCQFTEQENIHNHQPKHHTIRKGNRWKVGDWASLRVWSGKPYQSKQVEFAQVEIKKVWSFEINNDCFVVDRDIYIENNIYATYTPNVETSTTYKINNLTQNDGVSLSDFISWFGLDKDKIKPFSGQIISWNEDIEY